MKSPRIISTLPSLKVSRLRSLLTCIGASTAGNKQALIDRLQGELHRDDHAGRGADASSGVGERARILSIDMGIKNLAYCVCDVSTPFPQSAKGTTSGNRISLSVQAWRHTSVLDLNSLTHSSQSNQYHPSNMSLLAHRFVTKTVLPPRPSTILIERQRFRSGGHSAVQEWTLRVNTLEAMLWACLRCLTTNPTLSTATGRDGLLATEVYGVNPKQVATYWLRGNDGTKSDLGDSDAGEREEGGRKAKVEKKEKVELVRRWLSDSDPWPSSDEQGFGNVKTQPVLTFSREAALTKRAFVEQRHQSRRARRRVADEEVGSPRPSSSAATSPGVDDQSVAPNSDGDGDGDVGEPTGKLDDLADCLLQAAAWARWRENRAILRAADVGDADAVDGLLRELA